MEHPTSIDGVEVVSISSAIWPGHSKPKLRAFYTLQYEGLQEKFEVRVSLKESAEMVLQLHHDLSNPKIATMYKALRFIAVNLFNISEIAGMLHDEFASAYPEEDEALTFKDANAYVKAWSWFPKDHPEYEQFASVYEKALEWKHRYDSYQPAPGYVYLIRAIAPNNHYKIGLSKEPRKRLKFLGVKLPFPIEVLHLIPTNDRYRAEKYFHDRYANKRVDGEWFCLEPLDVDLLCMVENMMYGGAA